MDYTRKVGETSAVKAIIDFLDSQFEVIKKIEKKYSKETKEEYPI